MKHSYYPLTIAREWRDCGDAPFTYPRNGAFNEKSRPAGLDSATLEPIYTPISQSPSGTPGSAPEAVSEEEFFALAVRLVRAIDIKLRAIETRLTESAADADAKDARTLAQLTNTLQKLNVIVGDRKTRSLTRMAEARAEIHRRFSEIAAARKAERISRKPE